NPVANPAVLTRFKVRVAEMRPPPLSVGVTRKRGPEAAAAAPPSKRPRLAETLALPPAPSIEPPPPPPPMVRGWEDMPRGGGEWFESDVEEEEEEEKEEEKEFEWEVPDPSDLPDDFLDPDRDW